MFIGRYHYTIILNRLLDRDSTSCQSINTLFGGSGHGSHGEQHRQKKYKGSQSFHKMSSCSLLSKLQEPFRVFLCLHLYFYLCIGLLPFQLHRITISAFCKQIRRPVCFFVKSADCRHFILVKLLLLPFFLCI